MARDTVFGVPPREIQAAQTRAVTAADVQRVARRYLDPARFSVVVTRPAGAGRRPRGRTMSRRRDAARLARPGVRRHADRLRDRTGDLEEA